MKDEREEINSLDRSEVYRCQSGYFHGELWEVVEDVVHWERLVPRQYDNLKSNLYRLIYTIYSTIPEDVSADSNPQVKVFLRITGI